MLVAPRDEVRATNRHSVSVARCDTVLVAPCDTVLAAQRGLMHILTECLTHSVVCPYFTGCQLHSLTMCQVHSVMECVLHSVTMRLLHCVTNCVFCGVKVCLEQEHPVWRAGHDPSPPGAGPFAARGRHHPRPTWGRSTGGLGCALQMPAHQQSRRGRHPSLPPSLPPSVSKAVQGQELGLRRGQWTEGVVWEGQWRGQGHVCIGAVGGAVRGARSVPVNGGGGQVCRK